MSHNVHCLDARRALLADPHARPPGLAGHMAECPSCRAFAAALLREEEVLRTLLAVPVPEGLQEKILLNAQLNRRSWFERLRTALLPSQPWSRAGLALACSAVLAVAVWRVQERAPRLDWSEVMLAHTIDESGVLGSQQRIPQEKLAAVLADYGLTVKGNLGTVRFLERCPMPGGHGVHAVIDTPDLGTVTLLLPPRGTQVADGSAAAQGFNARLVAVLGTGIGVVTRDPAKVAALSARMQERLVARIG